MAQAVSEPGETFDDDTSDLPGDVSWSIVLAARFKKPVPIILGILVATTINHGLAGALGAWITAAVFALLGVGTLLGAGSRFGF